MKFSKTSRISSFAIILLSSSLTFATTWEYKVQTYPLIGNDQLLADRMNELGRLQWELVNCTEGGAEITCVFKRPIVEDE